MKKQQIIDPKLFKKFAILLIIFVAVIVAIIWMTTWAMIQFQPAAPNDQQIVRVVVAKGDTLSSVANELKQSRLIRNPLLFRYYMQLEGLDRQLQAGSYELSPSMSLTEIAQHLTTGTEDIWITLPEGWRAEEVAAYLSDQDLSEFDEQEFLRIAETSEGKFFPDTYLVPREISTTELAALLTSTFDQKVTQELSSELQESELSPKEVLILASIVEREARGLEDMRHVAGILLNRLDIGMPLQADATLQYISGYDTQEQDWWSPPSVSYKTYDSPFNTYLYPGLPPAPIANPGVNAVIAVLDPIRSNDLFYIHAPSGEAVYAETIEQHNANINAYLR